MSDVNLTIKAAAVGTTETAAELQKVSDAQKGVTTQVEASVKPAEEAVESQEKLHVSTSNYGQLLSQIHPQLGAFVNNLLRGANVAGEMATKSLNLADVFQGVTAAVTKNASALALLGAGGVAVLGLNFLISRIQKIGEEAEKSRKAMEDLAKAQTELERGRMASVRDIVGERDVDPRLKPFTFEQEESVRKTLEAAPEGLRDKLGPLLKEFGGGQGFGAGAGEFEAKQLEALAERGFTADESISHGRNAARARRFLQLEAPDIQAINERQAQEREATLARAAEEARPGSSAALEGQGNLEELIEESAKRRGVNPDQVRKVVEEEMRVEHLPGGVTWAAPWAALDEMRKGQSAMESVSTDEVLAKLRGGASGGANVTIQNTYHQQNQRHIGGDARAQRGRMKNGQSRVRSVEGW